MNEILLSNFLLVLGYLFYEGYLQKRGVVKANRYFLIGWVLLSMLIPFSPSYFTLSVQENVESIGYTLPTVDITSTFVQDSPNNLDWWFVGYGMVSFALLVRFIFKWFTISYLVSRANRIVHSGETVYASNEVEMPFTFMNKIVIPVDLDDSELPFVLKHERAHVNAHHGFDLVLIHLVQALNWFNPVVWFLEKAIRMNHEFEADQAVLSEESTIASDYKALLLSRAMSVSGFSLSHAMADESQLQKRFLKMNKSKSSTVWIYTLILPVLAIAFISKACTTNDSAESENENMEQPASIEEIFKGNEVDVIAEFPGGAEEMMKYLGSTIQYPEAAKKDSIEGRVYIEFTIDEQGNVIKPLPLNNVHEDLTKEAVRAVLEMPKWTPAAKDGKAVRVKMTLPISFKL